MIDPSETKLTKLIRQSPAALGIGVLALGAATSRAQLPSSYVPPELLQRTLEPKRSLITMGMFDLNPHVGGSAIYDSNIRLQQKPAEEDYIFLFSPGLDFFKVPDALEQSATTDLRITYNPALVFFANHDTNNSVDHYANLVSGVKLARLSVDVSQDYQSSSGGEVVDVASRVHQDYYRTGARIRYDISEKTSAQLSGSYRVTDYEELIDSEEWIEDQTVSYSVTPKVSLGFGVTVGQLFVGRTPPQLTNFIGRATAPLEDIQTYVTPGLRASYKTTEKTDVALSAGGELRFFEDSTSSFGPVFNLSGSYHPTDTIDLSLDAYRREQNSAVLGGQNYITTGVSFRVGQRFRERYRASLSFTYDNIEYESAKRGIAATRVDDYFLLRYGVDMIIATSWTVGVFHQYRVNASSSGFEYENHQINVQTIWAY